ncbi:MAG: tyrosine-type recombinase/integrase [Synechococcales bacterium]|nr:tyrosine-type recombinase/integrase [Synechococcales bacterium]
MVRSSIPEPIILTIPPQSQKSVSLNGEQPANPAQSTIQELHLESESLQSESLQSESLESKSLQSESLQSNHTKTKLTDSNRNDVSEKNCPDPRSIRIEEFLQARSLSARTQKAYRQDLQHFLGWTDLPWKKVTPRTIAQFKAHLLRVDIDQQQRVLSDASVRRVLGTLRNFFAWMHRCHDLSHDPTAEIQLPKVAAPMPQNLSSEQVEAILRAALQTNLPERNLALILVLLHGLRSHEAANLNLADYDGEQLQIRQLKAGRSGTVVLDQDARAWLDHYLQWRETQGELLDPQRPLFISHSRRNLGQRLGYDGTRKLIDHLSQQVGFDFNTYQFRHTFTNNLLLQGINLDHIMVLTRQSSSQHFRRYKNAIASAPSSQQPESELTESSPSDFGV